MIIYSEKGKMTKKKKDARINSGKPRSLIQFRCIYFVLWK
jgi:hypothetical protein